MKYRYTFKTDDNFEKGCCYDCPLSYTEYHDRDWEIYCVLHENECPLEGTDDILKTIDNIDYTHLLGYPSEVVAVEVINMVKEAIRWKRETGKKQGVDCVK